MYTYIKEFSAFTMMSHFQIKNSGNKNSGKTTIPCGNFNFPLHQTVHAPLSCSYHLAHPSLSLSYFQVVNVTAHSHCPLFHTIYRMGKLLLTLPTLRVTWMYVKSCSHSSPHELHFTSVIFDVVYITSKTCLIPVL